MTHLNLGSNRLTTIPFLCTTLTTLLLDDNSFEGTFPRFIGNLKQLKVLNIQRNQITHLCPHLGFLTTLEQLQVRPLPLHTWYCLVACCRHLPHV